ncbi:MAG TPA: biotin/lipoyl-containing protein, partial [Solirubrobacteraceae bacterium]|nr:biotin/lipoyl-containing protein [Solirubrobacteraceae bacterium]
MSDPVAHPVLAPFDAVVVALPLGAEDRVRAGAPVVVLEAMKMEHEVLAEVDGVVRELAVAVGEAVSEGQLLATLEPRAREGAADAAGLGTPGADGAPLGGGEPEGERADLQAVRERHETGLDPARPDAVARRHEHGRRTARENLGELIDEG